MTNLATKPNRIINSVVNLSLFYEVADSHHEQVSALG